MRGGAFVLADGHKHLGGCDGVHCASYNCSFGREPIYDKRNYHDVTGVELHQVNPQQKPTFHTDTPYYPFIYSAHSGESKQKEHTIRPLDVVPTYRLVDTDKQKAAKGIEDRRSECLPTRPRWVAPTFTIIPRIILNHSQPACAKPLTNFCPDCFTWSKTIKLRERGRVFIQTTKQVGVYVPQEHECGERPAA